MANKRIIITAQSGIKADDVIKNFLTHHEGFSANYGPKYLLFEQYLKDVYVKATGKLLTPTILSEILMEPIPHLYNWWKVAFEAMLQEVKDDEDYIVNLHACWYHHDTVEYLSLINYDLIKKFDPTVVVTFIDDIYDMQLRLKQEDQYLESKLYDSPSEMIKTAMQILDWRSKEILVARNIAQEFGVKHFVMAVKHPQKTLYDLLFSDKKTVYLSHPISEVRRLEAAGKNEKAELIKGEIEEISEKLDKIFVPLLPTTIDELRLKRSAFGKFEYQLTERWEDNKYKSLNSNILFLKPKNTASKDYFGEGKTNDTDTAYLSELLSVFFDRIAKQVSSRDKKMVEQGEVLFVYRPCFNGNMSKGVLAEIVYYHKLLSGADEQKKCIIYCPEVDQNELKVTALENEISLFFRLEEGDFKFTDREKAEVLINFDSEALQRLVKGYLEDHKLDISKKWQVLNPDPMRMEKDVIEEFITKAKTMYSFWIDNNYRKMASDGLFFEENSLTPSQIVSRIESVLKSK